jgi:hypothetical protein
MRHGLLHDNCTSRYFLALDKPEYPAIAHLLTCLLMFELAGLAACQAKQPTPSDAAEVAKVAQVADPRTPA